MNFVVAVNNFGDTRAGGLAGPMGLFIIVVLCVATVLLIRNMNKRVRRLPDSFQDSETRQRQAEIARLNSDLGAPASAARPWVDGDRSGAPTASMDAEVTDVSEAGGPAARPAGNDRA